MGAKHVSPSVVLNTVRLWFGYIGKKISPCKIITARDTWDTQKLPVLKQYCGKGTEKDRLHAVPKRMTL